MEIIFLLIWLPLPLHIYFTDYRDRRQPTQVITGFLDRKHRDLVVEECQK